MNTEIYLGIPTDPSLYERIDVTVRLDENTNEIIDVKDVITIPDDTKPDVVCSTRPITVGAPYNHTPFLTPEV
jgi:hypothetical protein